jgi:glycosyltransferase involved in cell wall biosynthesis
VRIFREWDLFCHYSKQLQATHSLLLYFDVFQIPLALGVKAPCPFSGIYFRPRFHYNNFVNHVASWQDILRQWWDKFLLIAAMQNPQLKTLYSLDNFAVQYVSKLSNRVKVLPLADPIEEFQVDASEYQRLKLELQVESNRQIFLLFGAIDGRKGIYPLLDAIKLLPVEACKQICLLLIGKIASSDKIKLSERLSEISQTWPIQIIIRDEFVSFKLIPYYFKISDFILVLYQKHVGMSGIILHAAAARKPVLASDYGLIGKLVLEYELGLILDSTSPDAIAKNLQKMLKLPPQDLINPQKMQQLVQQNSNQEFAKQIFNSLRDD